MNKKIFNSAAALMACGLLLAGCSSANEENAQTAEDRKASVPIGDEITTTKDDAVAALVPEKFKNQAIQVAIGFPFPPMNFVDNERDMGFDPEIARLLGQKMGIDVQINRQDFTTIIPSLQSGKNHLSMAGMNDTAERQETLTFVDYIHAGFNIVVLEGNPANIKTQKDLCGKTVALQKSTMQGGILEEMNCGVKLTELPNDVDAQTALRAGKADAYVTDAAVAVYAAQTVDGFEIIADPENPAGFNPIYSGIGILKTDTELITAIQAGLQALIEEGTYQKVLERNGLEAYAVEKAELNLGQ